MTRISLFESLKLKEVSYINEVQKIHIILSNSYSKANSFFENALKKSPFNCEFLDFNSGMIELLDLEIDKNWYTPKDNINSIFRLCNDMHTNLTINSFLDILEYFKTVEYYGNKKDSDSNVKQIMAIINDRCDRLGYTFKFDQDKQIYFVMLKNIKAETVATFVEEKTRKKIYNYLICRNGDIENKRLHLKSLADDIENSIKKLSKSENIKFFDKLKEIIQCVRHTKDNDENKKKFPFYYQSEEEWLNKIFEMVIAFLSFEDARKYMLEIKELQKQNGGE